RRALAALEDREQQQRQRDQQQQRGRHRREEQVVVGGVHRGGEREPGQQRERAARDGPGLRLPLEPALRQDRDDGRRAAVEDGGAEAADDPDERRGVGHRR